jgi:hypothetical protein
VHGIGAIHSDLVNEGRHVVLRRSSRIASTFMSRSRQPSHHSFFGDVLDGRRCVCGKAGYLEPSAAFPRAGGPRWPPRGTPRKEKTPAWGGGELIQNAALSYRPRRGVVKQAVLALVRRTRPDSGCLGGACSSATSMGRGRRGDPASSRVSWPPRPGWRLRGLGPPAAEVCVC